MNNLILMYSTCESLFYVNMGLQVPISGLQWLCKQLNCRGAILLINVCNV